jgi:putative glutathione S-transferase
VGLLINGTWVDQKPDDAPEIDFKIDACKKQLNGTIDPDPSTPFPAERGRYALYVSLTCPFAHRVLQAYVLKDLHNIVELVHTVPITTPHGWIFNVSNGYPDLVEGTSALHELYTLHDPEYSGNVTVPMLWDKKTKRIVNNGSVPISKILNTAFDAFGAAPINLYNRALAGEIDTFIHQFETIFNRSIMRAGLAKAQDEYEIEVRRLFDWFDTLEIKLQAQRFIVGNAITLADIVAFTGFARFDALYYLSCKCNLKRLRDYPNLWGYICDLYQHPGVADTVDIPAYKESFFQYSLIPNDGIIPIGPEIDFTAPHDRAKMTD